MKKLLLSLTIVGFSLSYVANAQQPITITEEDIASVGSTVIRAYDSIASCLNLTIQKPADTSYQVWDFSHLQVHRQDTIDFVNPSTTAYSGLYPGSNIAGVSTTGEISYMHRGGDTLTRNGFVGYSYYPPTVMTKNFLPIIWEYPTVYNTTLHYLTNIEIRYPATKDSTINMERHDFYVTYYCGDTVTVPQSRDIITSLPVYGITTPTYVDSFMMIRKEIRQYFIDGYGELITPDGSFDVLLQRIIYVSLDTLYAYFNGSRQIVQTYDLYISLLEWKWWAKNIGVPILEVVIETAWNSDSIVDYKNVYWTRVFNGSINDNICERNVKIFPNPASDILYIELLDLNAENIVTIYDVLGKQVKRINIHNNQRAEVSVKDMEAGVYFVNIITEGNIPVTKRIIVNH